jgi:hypothetical protein
MVDPRGRTLAAGSTAAVTVNVPGPPPTSTLVVVAAPASGLPQGAAVRVPLSKTAPATPAVTEWTLTHTHAGDDSGTELPLTSACEGLGLSKRVQVGTVQADGKELAISGSCSDAKAKSLMLTTPDISSDGRTYKGKIKVADAEVDLTVEDTLSWMAVALLIAIGIGAAIGVTAWQGWGRGARDLLRKTYLVEQLVSARNERSADASFAKAAAELGLPPNVQAWTIADAVRTKLAGLRSLLRGTPTADGLKKSGEELVSLELEVRRWPDTANRLGELRQRAGRLSVLRGYLDGIFPRTLEREGPLDLDDMRDVRAAADEAVALANDWPAAPIEAAQRVAQNLPPDAPARLHLESVLERFAAATKAPAAVDVLDDFWVVDRELREAAVRKLRDAAVAPAIVDAAMPGAGGPAWTGVFLRAATHDPARVARGLAAQIWVIDMWVFGVLMIAALVGGMQALWVDKSFGGAWDVAAALVWGLGAGALGQQLSAALGDLARAWASATEHA